ncbi:alpha/beta hydrolase [Methylobacterium sp. P31]
MFFYGGSWQNGSKDDYAFVGHALAAQGFVTVLPDYRLFPEAPFPGFLEDGAQAVAWVRENIAAYGGDPRRIVLAGHSAGAYNAVMLGLDPRYLTAAGVDPKVIRAVAGLSGPYDFLPLDQDTTIKVFGAAPDQAATQPGTFVGPLSPPAFLATGDIDTVVKPRHTVSLAAKLRAEHVPVQERLYPGLDHKDTLLALSVTFRSKAPEARRDGRIPDASVSRPLAIHDAALSQAGGAHVSDFVAQVRHSEAPAAPPPVNDRRENSGNILGVPLPSSVARLPSRQAFDRRHEGACAHSAGCATQGRGLQRRKRQASGGAWRSHRIPNAGTASRLQDESRVSTRRQSTSIPWTPRDFRGLFPLLILEAVLQPLRWVR